MEAVTRKKKLIEVALPLDDINKACAREKSIRHGHPSTLHLWWARRPLAAARAVIFAQMVDDPSEHPEQFATDAEQEEERQRLFALIKELVQWESTTDLDVLERARAEIRKHWKSTCAANGGSTDRELYDDNVLPTFLDPFAGGGALPLEAQRLGLKTYASDINPVAVLINKAMIEIPPRFAGLPPVNKRARNEQVLIDDKFAGARGLAADVREYGVWMREEAHKRIGGFYPTVKITTEMAKARPDLLSLVGSELTVVAWLWARTVKSPNPAFAETDVPLASTFTLSPMADKEAYVEPLIEGSRYRFVVRLGQPKNAKAVMDGTKVSGKGGFRCLLSDTPITFDYIREQASAGKMSARIMAVVAEGKGGRIYLSPTPEMEVDAARATPTWLPDSETFGKCRVNIGLYGMTTWDKLFTDRQLVALSTFADLVQEAREKVKADALAAGMANDELSLVSGGSGATAYADAVATYLGFLVSKLADKGSTLCTWDMGPTSSRTHSGRSARAATVRVTFARQALAMTWDFAEVNFFSDSVGSLETVLNTLTVPLAYLPPSAIPGVSVQRDAATGAGVTNAVVSTDPPYYDNIGYADLSDFFYVWLRRSLKDVYPELFATLGTPKKDELVATPYRHDSKAEAEAFFLDGMTKAMHRIAEATHPAFPVTIYYAFKQVESKTASGTASTGWETFLEAVIRAGFAISGTWPMRTELGNRMIGRDSNALASSIVLVCRPRLVDASVCTRREFLVSLKAELPTALRHLQRENIAPVDLAQAAIGPGMAVFTRFSKVLDASGKRLSVRDALALINEVLDEILAEQEGDFDAESRFAISWFDQNGFEEGEFGVADVLARAKNTTVHGLTDSGIAVSRGGKFRLLKSSELKVDWDPASALPPATWDVVHHVIRALEADGEAGAAKLISRIGSQAEVARELAYRLYAIAERRKRTAEALSYNGLVQSWPEMLRLSRDTKGAEPIQTDLLGAF